MAQDAQKKTRQKRGQQTQRDQQPQTEAFQALQAAQAARSHTERTVKHRPETEAKRRELLRIALLEFGSKGIEKATLEDIARQAGMTRAGVLHYFGSKRNLLIQVLDFRDADDISEMSAGIPKGMAAFRHLIRTAYVNEKRPGVTQAYAVLSAEATTAGNAGRPFFTRRYDWLRTKLVQDLRDEYARRGWDVTAQKESQFQACAASVLAVMDGLQLQAALSPEEIDLGAASEQAIRNLVTPLFVPPEDEEAVRGLWEPQSGD